MLNKKITIAMLTLALCASALTACGNNVDDVNGNGSSSESGTAQTESNSTSSSNESATEGTESMGTESSVPGTTGSESQGTTATESGSSQESNSESGSGSESVTEEITNDARRGINNVKDGVQNFFEGENGGRRHRAPAPFGK
jgi:ABC-type oligopeptide transport system substrate-binding subunit